MPPVDGVCSTVESSGCLNGYIEGRCHLTHEDGFRFSVPLYTVGEAARIVDVPPSTLASWARGYVRHFPDRPDVIGRPVITCFPQRTRQEPSLPFVGLAEALVLAAARRSGVPMQRVRPALDELQRQMGTAHALASRRLYTDGAELLYDYDEACRAAGSGRQPTDLVVVRSNQRVFVDVLDRYLRRIEYGPDGYASVIHVPAYDHAEVVADPTRSFGAPIFERGAARVADVLDRFWAGETLSDLAGEFGVPADQLEDVVRVTSRRAA